MNLGWNRLVPPLLWLWTTCEAGKADREGLAPDHPGGVAAEQGLEPRSSRPTLVPT